jgi:hypothetical protein
MEKAFAFGISGVFATATAGTLCMPVLFAQAQGGMGMFELAERLGLGVVILIVCYKIIIHIINVYERALITKLNTHDSAVQGRLSGIEKKIDEHISSVSKKG